MPIKTHKIRIYPNDEMVTVITELMDYNRFCWNKGWPHGMTCMTRR
jgi:putative transposase